MQHSILQLYFYSSCHLSNTKASNQMQSLIEEIESSGNASVEVWDLKKKKKGGRLKEVHQWIVAIIQRNPAEHLRILQSVKKVQGVPCTEVHPRSPANNETSCMIPCFPVHASASALWFQLSLCSSEGPQTHFTSTPPHYVRSNLGLRIWLETPGWFCLHTKSTATLEGKKMSASGLQS